MDEPDKDPEVDDRELDDEQNDRDQSKTEGEHFSPRGRSKHFRSYPSITNVDSQLMMKLIIEEGHTRNGIEWVMTEKFMEQIFSSS